MKLLSRNLHMLICGEGEVRLFSPHNVKKKKLQGTVQMKKLCAVAAITIAVLTPIHAHAGTGPTSGDIPFSGTVNDSCIINIGDSGTLVANTDLDVLGSKVAGGSAGTAEVLVTGGNYTIGVTAPATFTTAPTTGNDNISIVAEYAVSGANNIPETTGDETLNRGRSDVTINMTATKTVANEVFESGDYDATVVLRCD